jgi:hypothetical protein
MTTLTPEQIINGNKDIAKLMDKAFHERSYASQSSPTVKYVPHVSELKYHSSLDWLLPVLEKIKTLGADVEINLNGMLEKVEVFHSHVSIRYSLTLINMLKDEGFLYSKTYYIKDRTVIEAAWLACVEFIEWYNKQENL